MHRRFTNAWLVALSLVLGACSSVPVPFAGSDGEPIPAETAALRQEVSGPALHTLPQAAVPTPPINSGNQALFDRGVELMREGSLSAAEVLFEELTADQPELAGPWVNLGFIYISSGELDKAQAAFEQAVAANPANCDALNQLGVMARRDGRFQDAEQSYQACIQAQPLYAPAHLNLGILYELYMGRLSEALAAYNEYQLMLPEPDQQVTGWVMDLERRVAAIATR